MGKYYVQEVKIRQSNTMPRPNDRNKQDESALQHRTIVDAEQEYGPDLPFLTPEVTGWVRRKELSERLKEQYRANLLGGNFALEIETLIRRWVGEPLYVHDLSQEEKELEAPSEFALYLKEQ